MAGDRLKPKEILDFVDAMRERGVEEFEALGVRVKFNPGGYVSAPSLDQRLAQMLEQGGDPDVLRDLVDEAEEVEDELAERERTQEDRARELRTLAEAYESA